MKHVIVLTSAGCGVRGGACSRVSGGHPVKFSWTGVDRHVMVKGATSPDGPALTDYWAKRRQRVKSPLDEYTLRLLTR